MRKAILAVLILAVCLPLQAQRNTPTYLQMQTATIASSGSLSGAVALGNNTVVGIYIPASWTTANLTFSCSTNNGNFSNVYSESGSEYMATVAAASTYIALDPQIFTGCSFIKIRSGTSGSPVSQAAARSLDIIMRPW